MAAFFNFFTKVPSLKGLPLKSYSINLSLNRLNPGVNNIRLDVHLSPEFCKITSKVILQLIVRRFKSSHTPGLDKKFDWFKERDEFKRLCHDVLIDAINKAKLAREVQIDYLAQIAVIELFVREIRKQYEATVQNFKNVIHKHEIVRNQAMTIELKEELSKIMQDKRSVFREVGIDVFKCLFKVQTEGLNELREVNFGSEAILPDEFFSNSFLQVDNPYDDVFMIEEYMLLGHRFEDPNRYEALIYLIKSILGDIYKKDFGPQEISDQDKFQDNYDKIIDNLIKEVDNIDILFNYFHTQNLYGKLKKHKGDKEGLLKLKQRLKEQKAFLNLFLKKFSSNGLMKSIIAFYEMRHVYHEYCPPLFPQEVLQFIVTPRARKNIINKLKKFNKYYGKSYSLTPLRKIINNQKRIANEKKKEYLLQFIKDFARYHRDLENFKLLKDAIDCVNLTFEERIIKLSRANNTLYEFLLPHELVVGEKPIINHVIIKADVRGSSDIVNQMNEKGLNPASNFSLNFFDPIAEILSRYGALKVFIEGDAVILSIYEHADTPGNWYSVARACGLAVNMLQIIQRYNIINKKNNLPNLEIGIGIEHCDGPPTFFFEGDNRIMISPAINKADRLSGCEKSLRILFFDRKMPFNLYVFQTITEKDISVDSDDLLIRYNVRGIELSETGFEKLSKEIDLELIECKIPELQKDKIGIYTGKFPTVSGRYQRIVIREEYIPEVNPSDMSIIQMTSRKYYEVCNYDIINKYLFKILKEK